MGAEVHEDISSLVLTATSLFEFSALDIAKTNTALSTFRPKVPFKRKMLSLLMARQVCLVVNVASK